ncbi:ABC transporter ATP-binding protein [Butyrivibrio sp. INlla16]|uniref:ABC transporter ATP-binding protein n=1 Tax=Butyrivibrio sp. INlla16 TaxID=1520807 RepID=UPI0008860C93|nr:ABC transporter ATP-binding protein [Butyrivibrio sp. INlla16]SDB65752.1 ABC-2 type transport system ATP-binding protein [Butyrivibrio sp. INlla16]
MICCKGVCKSFSEKQVLSGIDFDINSGEIFGLLGPSGAGKTTLIKILTGQLSSDKGSVSVFDKEVSSLSGEDKKSIGIMMDQFGVYERLSCRDNLKIFADIYGVPHDRIRDTLEQVGLKDAEYRSAANLSKGMRARLALARVFMHSPKLIFLDEPTGGLDPQTMRQIHRIILEKKEKGCTVFLTTHNMEEAYKLCDRVALLNEGVIVEHGAPEDICRKYNHQKTIKMHFSSGEDIQMPHSPESAERISRLLSEGRIETIHSSEPTLETVFLELTGRKLEEDE